MLTRKSMEKHDSKRVLVVKQLALKHKVTQAFVYLAIRGERDSELAMEIKKDYYKLYNAIESVLK